MLHVEGVSHSFGKFRVLDGIDCELPHGKILALLGASGCGKTTLLRLVAGLERLSEGRIALNGRLLSGAGHHVPPHERRVGLVFQEYALFPHLTVEENVRFGLSRRADARERALSLLEQVGLSRLRSRYPHELSGGQQQRVALVRSLATSPELLCLDEPFSGLDALLREKTRRETLGLLRASGQSAILVTHDPDEAFAFADLVAVMRGGRILRMGSPSDVYDDPRHLDVARLVSGTDLFEIPVELGHRLGLAGARWVRPGDVRLAAEHGPSRDDEIRFPVHIRSADRKGGCVDVRFSPAAHASVVVESRMPVTPGVSWKTGTVCDAVIDRRVLLVLD